MVHLDGHLTFGASTGQHRRSEVEHMRITSPVIVAAVLTAGCVDVDSGSACDNCAGLCMDGVCVDTPPDFAAPDLAMPGCGKDTDCKGNRLCVNGVCVEPLTDFAAP